jgi:amino acid permease
LGRRKKGFVKITEEGEKMITKKRQKAIEWVLVALIVGVIMFFGKIRMHQLNINRFLVLGYAIILFLLIVFWVVNQKAASTEEKE